MRCPNATFDAPLVVGAQLVAFGLGRKKILATWVGLPVIEKPGDIE